MSDFVLPEPQEVARLLGEIIDRGIEGSEGEFGDLDRPRYAATYGDSHGRLAGCFVFDLDAAARLGAALTVVPAGRAEDAVGDGQLDEGLEENFQEVCNISVALLARASDCALSLRELLPPGSGSLDPVLAELEDSTRADVAIEVDGYGASHIMMVGRHLASLEPADEADSADSDVGDADVAA